MKTFVIVIHLLVSFILISSILLQSGKSAGLSGAISGGAESIWGKSKGRSYEGLLAKVTAVGAILFVVTSVSLVVLR